jgi:hypothetical protein
MPKLAICNHDVSLDFFFSIHKTEECQKCDDVIRKKIDEQLNTVYYLPR